MSRTCYSCAARAVPSSSTCASALGASSWRIARSLLAESGLLALLGGLAGFAVAYGALQGLLALAPPQLPRLDSIALDARSVGFGLLATLAAAALFSLAPMFRAARAQLSTRLRGSRGASAGRAQHRAQNALVVGQVALALVLLVSSGLMIRTFEALRAVEPGFAEPESLQTFRINVPTQLVPDQRAIWRLQRSIEDSLEAIPGVDSAAFANALPMEGATVSRDDIEVEGVDPSQTTTACASSITSPRATSARWACRSPRAANWRRRTSRTFVPWRSSPRRSPASSGRRRTPRWAAGFGPSAVLGGKSSASSPTYG